MELGDKDKAFLADQIRLGNVILFFGAGINEGARNTRGHPIKNSAGLVSLLREKTHISEEDVSLGDLVEEYRLNTGDAGLQSLLNAEFANCTPSTHHKTLLSYAWHRIYTLNIDDALESVPRICRAQHIVQVNRTDPVEERRGFDNIEIVHLNGFVGNQQAGFVFTPSQYRAETRRSSTWYTKCAVDFFDKIFVFIGTSLNEPIFEAHVEELSRTRGQLAARSFIVSPKVFGEVRIRRLAEKRIEPVLGTFASFVEFLKAYVGEGLTPNQIASQISGQPVLDGYPSALLQSVQRIGTKGWISKHRLSAAAVRVAGRDFFNGVSPTWATVANSIPSELSHDKVVFERLKKFHQGPGGLLVVTGQSGSGKTTALMKAALRLTLEGIKVFSIKEDTRVKLRDTIQYLIDTGEEPAVLLVNNLVLFSDELLNIDDVLRDSSIYIFGQARSRDWESRISRCVPTHTELVELTPLTDADYSQLRNGIIEHAVAPKFLALNDQGKQIAFLKNARRQLLVLMMEATQQRRFEIIIEDEYKSISSAEAKAAFAIIGLATLAKNQLTVGELQSILTQMSPDFDASRALTELHGIVIWGANGLVGRHEIYVRHVFDLMMDAQELKDTIVGCLRYFVHFGQPVITKLSRHRGNMFKFLLNADQLYEAFGKKKQIKMAERVYSSVEYEYQRDGHYWLQRGLFYRRLRNHFVARDCLEKSIGAYPENNFARHALAQQKLIAAAIGKRRTPELERDVREAVDELNYQTQSRTVTDEYPLVTLARFHPEVLMQWGDPMGARAFAQEYFQRLEAFRRSIHKEDRKVESARANCLMLATTGAWKGPKY